MMFFDYLGMVSAYTGNKLWRKDSSQLHFAEIFDNDLVQVQPSQFVGYAIKKTVFKKTLEELEEKN